MLLRTFLARDMQDALYRVHREMGPDAIIVSNQRARTGVMVRAAVDVSNTAGTDIAREEASPPSDEIEFAGTFEQIFGIQVATLIRPSIRNESAREKFNRLALLRILAAHRLQDSLAHPLAEAAEKSGCHEVTQALAFALERRLRFTPILADESHALLLVGPSGAGKTSVAVKIAAQARCAGRNAILVAADTNGAGATAQLETLARDLNVAVEAGSSADAIEKLVEQARKRNVLAVIDTAGFDPRDPKARAAFAGLSAISNVEAVGIVSATDDAEEIIEVTCALKTLGVDRLIVTRLDATRRLGALVAAVAQGAGFAHATSSPLADGGLDILTPLSLARSLVEIGGSLDL